MRTGHRLLHHQHILCIYVDDTFALLPRKVAGQMACLSAWRARRGFHCPGIRWHLETHYSGLDGPCMLAVIRDPCAVLPTEQQQLIL